MAYKLFRRYRRAYCMVQGRWRVCQSNAGLFWPKYCLGQGGGIRQQTGSAAHGGHANSMHLCYMVEQLSCRTLRGGCKLQHHHDTVNVSGVRPGQQHPKSDLSVQEPHLGLAGMAAICSAELGKDVCHNSVTASWVPAGDYRVTR